MTKPRIQPGTGSCSSCSGTREPGGEAGLARARGGPEKGAARRPAYKAGPRSRRPRREGGRHSCRTAHIDAMENANYMVNGLQEPRPGVESQSSAPAGRAWWGGFRKTPALVGGKWGSGIRSSGGSPRGRARTYPGEGTRPGQAQRSVSSVTVVPRRHLTPLLGFEPLCD